MNDIGFEKLEKNSWSEFAASRIKKLSLGKREDWTKRSLKGVREELSAYLFTVQNQRCAYCRREIRNEIGCYEIDHIIPKESCERFVYERLNLILTCKSCNNAKSTHNPCITKLQVHRAYPTNAASYKWVHPYIHQYSEHISIKEMFIYEAVGNGTKYLRGLSVITKCKLERIKTIEEIEMARISTRSRPLIAFIFGLLGRYHYLSDNELATQIAEEGGRPYDSIQSLESLIAAIRSGDSHRLQRTLEKFHGLPVVDELQP